MDRRLMDFLGGRREVERGGFSLKILTARQLLEVGQEVETRNRTEGEIALLRNAAILARAVQKNGVPVSPPGKQFWNIGVQKK